MLTGTVKDPPEPHEQPAAVGLPAAGGAAGVDLWRGIVPVCQPAQHQKDISRSLQIQFSVFQNDMERYFDQLAVMGVNLSEDMSAEVDKELALRQMSFAQLNDSPEVLNALEEK